MDERTMQKMAHDAAGSGLIGAMSGAYAGQMQANALNQPSKQTQATYLTERLARLIIVGRENVNATNMAAEKIVGPEPTPMAADPRVNGIQGSLPANFLGQIERVIDELERIGQEQHDATNRLHRAF